MKRRMPFVIAGTIALLAVALGALFVLKGAPTPVALGSELVAAGKPGKTTGSQVGEQLPIAINGFGVDLLTATSASAEANANVIVSPLSVHAALSMTGNGATGETAAQMRAVLHTEKMAPAEANQQWADLLTGLAARSPEQELDVANALFARKGIPFKQPFLDADRDFFGAQVSTLDFEKDDVAGAINAWVSKNTKGMIPQILDKTDPAAILYLANAVYFKGDWVAPFRHESTSDQPFTRADGSKVDVPMMRATSTLPYAENASLTATKLVYKGFDASYYVMLPREGVSLKDALASLEDTGFSDLRTGLTAIHSGEIHLELPKLDAEFSANLNGALADLGMPRAFDALAAEFTGMADVGQPIYISRVLHKTKVKVDEKGTEAAAATVVEMTWGAVMEPPPAIACDRPYLFAIVDEKTGTMLFLGAVGDPTKTK